MSETKFAAIPMMAIREMAWRARTTLKVAPSAPKAGPAMLSCEESVRNKGPIGLEENSENCGSKRKLIRAQSMSVVTASYCPRRKGKGLVETLKESRYKEINTRKRLKERASRLMWMEYEMLLKTVRGTYILIQFLSRQWKCIMMTALATCSKSQKIGLLPELESFMIL